MRQIILDTETTGLEPEHGHRIIEIGCVELVGRRPTGHDYHQYLQPDRDIDEAALEVHGITRESLADKPRFGDIAQDLLDYLRGAELIIHNAPFDVGFLNAEFGLLGKQWGRIEDHCAVLDTLAMARQLHPGQRNTLDALCKRYGVDSSQRTLHGALLDAEILVDVYLAMTGGQVYLSLGDEPQGAQHAESPAIRPVDGARRPLPVVFADPEERAAHERYLELLDAAAGAPCLWRSLDPPER
ncbi:MAG: DNA polymerase III subunit epsilon [Chromatiales bacterium 21-64-14]|nr:MAG: DNA polymerase III subunit epsilon [Chromatiales bacterium 21-64-14]HQU16435.1 DNA polymerase III subunit epsilon [Gammaproteobacteria bacterium]